MSPEMYEELLLLMRSQQREIAELRQSQLELLQRLTGHMDAVQSSVMAHVEHVMLSQQEQERILSTRGSPHHSHSHTTVIPVRPERVALHRDAAVFLQALVAV